MNNKSDKVKLLRQFESLLDRNHITLGFWGAPAGNAAFSLFSVFDCSCVDDLMQMIWSQSADLNAFGVQDDKYEEEGLAQSIRWFYPTGEIPDIETGWDFERIAEAKLFLRWASKYVTIADFHKAFGRKVVDFEVDADTKEVTFSYPNGFHKAAAINGMEIHARRTNLQLRSFEQLPSSQSGNLMSKIGDAVKIEKGRVVISDKSIFSNPHVRDFGKKFGTEPILPLMDEENLNGMFTVSDFRKFYGAIQTWSIIAQQAFLELVGRRIDPKRPDIKSVVDFSPTQVVSKSDFFGIMSDIAELPIELVQRISLFLKYDNRTTWGDIFLQPLLFTGHQIAWSTTVVGNSSSERNLLRLLARTDETKNYASSLIGRRDRQLAVAIGKHLQAKAGYQYSVETKIESLAEKGDIDLLAYNSKYPKEVLIVECKAVLAADEINEVAAATSELAQGQKQLLKIKRIMASLTDAEKRRMFPFVKWEHITSCHGLVMTPETEAGPQYVAGEVPAISLSVLQYLFSQRQLQSPRKIWQRAKDMPWLTKYNTSVNTHENITISVGAITYKLPALTLEQLDAVV